MNKGNKKLVSLPIFIFAALVGVFLALLLTPRDKTELPSALINLPPPTFDLAPLPNLSSNERLSNKDFEQGKLYLVNIFASWCVPCRIEHPNLMTLAQENEVEIIGINYKDKTENAQKFLEELGNPYKKIGVDPSGRTALDWGVYGIPESFLITGDGLIHTKIVGPVVDEKYQELRRAIMSQN